ncbi:molybdopterin-dependent oxidoreductase [Nonomuraea sp. K274]|uniref:Molybdopterin-dependent oxidoreductase n=2 Tax=Nonomuraea cypriaca TaxID=1187855 RepID=A0A931AAJ5_9ACTN|nr:molybdopterin-dependent oxidoreductase [Nonomuraea cypriaca]MBF8188293.1 molybdopterin-dependent oxidoreductase [Nonomuraea cypriaca]
MVPAWAGALAGLASGGVALGIAQLVAGFVGPETFPVVAVGDVTVDLTPAPVKDFAIRTFGASDKAVLIGGVLVVLAGVAALIGVLARRRLAYGFAGLGGFAVVGLLAVLTRPDTNGALDALPTLVGAFAGAWTLSWLVRRAGGPAMAASAASAGSSGSAAAPDGDTAERPGISDTSGASNASDASSVSGEPRASGVSDDSATSGAERHGVSAVERPAVVRSGADLRAFDRRRLLTGVAGGAVVATAATVLGRQFGGRQALDAARAELALPRPATPARPIPAGANLGLKGLAPFITPNRDFYEVHTALVLPQVDPNEWRLRIHGLVDRPVEFSYADLLKMPLTEADVTLTCVSNEVGGDLVGNARWLGVRMADVLRRAGLRSDADMLLSTSADGFTCGTPADVVMDGRDALFAVAMNGEVLPVSHGFPVRQVVPGLYGYVSATKWLVDIKVTRFDQDEAYWTPRGWSAMGPIKTQSRIDIPATGDSLKVGRTTIAGVAWAQHTGVDAVEVRVDRGQWREARLAETPGADTWRQWSIDWDATAGQHTIEVRATDAAGRTQTEEMAPPAPDGATGWHTITVQVA